MAELRKVKNQYLWSGVFEERLLPKEAKFRWDPKAKMWWTDDPHKAMALRNYMDKDTLAAAEAAVAEKSAVLEASMATDCNVEYPVPKGLEYLGYQKAGVHYAMSRSNVLIGDEMGLGKTIQAIGVINADEKIKDVLIICPASLKINWLRECEKWTTRNMSVGIVESKLGMPNTNITIINYDILKKFSNELHSRTWDMLICDECHYLKNPKAIRTKEVFGFWDRKNKVSVSGIQARRKVMLTGTPIVNRPVELWPIVNALDPQKFANFMYFAKRYCNAHQKMVTRNKMVWDFSGSSNLEELQKILRERIMVRRLKADVLKELPAKIRQIIELPANGAAAVINRDKKATEAVSAELRALKAACDNAGSQEAYAEAASKLSEATQVAFTAMAKVRHDTAVAKIPAVIDFLENALESGNKIVLMAHHHDVIDAIANHFSGIAVTLTGRTPMAERQVAVDRFQTDDSVRLFVGNIKAAGVGLTLTAASHVIFAELDWTPGNVSQAEDRCHRIGQTDSVLVQHLVFDGTLDARMAKTIVAKQRVMDRALDNKIDDVSIMDLSWVEALVEKDLEKAHNGAKVKPEIISAVHVNLRRLARVCDGAMERDNMGFNGVDSAFGRSLAYQDHISGKQAIAARKILTKYKGQLGEEAVAAMWETA